MNPNPYYQDDVVVIYHADCRDISLRGISAVVTDPPYNLTSISKRFGNANARNTPSMDTPEGSVWARKAKGFMNKEWDGTGISFQADTWRLFFESCLPGAMLLSFGGTRTYHRMVCAIEDAGFEIRDCIMWVYGSGFPKSLNIGKAVDKLQGNERETVGITKGRSSPIHGGGQSVGIDDLLTKGTSEWEGYGTALKPSYEPIILAMKPLDGTFADNALKYKVAGLNIDGCRIGVNGGGTHCNNRDEDGKCLGHPDRSGTAFGLTYHTEEGNKPQGRFPANFIHNGSQEVMELFPNTGGGHWSYKQAKDGGLLRLGLKDLEDGGIDKGKGSAARFFYCAKASRSERDEGLRDIEGQTPQRYGEFKGTPEHSPNRQNLNKNTHPTVKPLALMEYLCKLVKMPEYNLILDPFCGSGSTLLACKKLGIKAIGIEIEEEYCEIAAKRLSQSM